jgi:hypothetical protein
MDGYANESLSRALLDTSFLSTSGRNSRASRLAWLADFIGPSLNQSASPWVSMTVRYQWKLCFLDRLSEPAP